MSDLGLGRCIPPDWEHLSKYPLTAEHVEALPAPAPVVIGINWYTDFDSPEQDKDGHYWIGRSSDLGSIRGGHCVTLQSGPAKDPTSWWTWYNQVSEGICVGEGGSRCMSLLNRRRYQPRWLYDACKKIDPWPGQEGTAVRYAFDVLRNQGHVRAKPGERQGLTEGQYDGRTPNPGDGIAANRWARSVDDVQRALGTPGREYAVIINSWGRDYPHYVRIPVDTLDRLRREDGEIGIVTDR